jgi:dUTP pyrophosphatase
MQTLPIKIKKLTENAALPKYATVGDAGLDLVATSRQISQDKNGYQITYGTGLAFEIPEGFLGLLFSRSSINETGLGLSNAVGVIDSGYRGEVQLIFRDLSPARTGKIYDVGERVGQLIILPYPVVEFEEVTDELSTSARGEDNFGSTNH